MGQGVYKAAVFLPPLPTYAPPTFIEDAGAHIALHGEHDVPIVVQRAPEGSRFEQYCIMYSHGNAEDLGQMVGLLARISSEVGVNVASYDYQGYGPSYGVREPGEDECYRDARFVFDFLTSPDGEFKFHGDRVVLFGRSLGSGPTTNLGLELSQQKVQFGGVILQSPLTSAVRVVSKMLSHVTVDMFQNFKKIGRIRRPVTIVHGMEDEVVPFAHGRELADTLIQADADLPLRRLIEFVEIPGAGHNNIEGPAHWPTLRAAIVRHLEFLEQQEQFTWLGPEKKSFSPSSI